MHLVYLDPKSPYIAKISTHAPSSLLAVTKWRGSHSMDGEQAQYQHHSTLHSIDQQLISNFIVAKMENYHMDN